MRNFAGSSSSASAMRSSASDDSADSAICRSALRVGGIEALGEGFGALTASLVDVGRRGVRGDAVEPSREGGVAAELPDALPGPQVRLLHHVARILLVARETTRQREGVDESAAHQFVERLSITAAGGAEQLGFVQRVLPFWVRLRPDPGTKGYALGLEAAR